MRAEGNYAPDYCRHVSYYIAGNNDAYTISHLTGTIIIQVKDLLQLMIDATVDEDTGDNSSRKKLTSTEIAGFSVDFFLAGYETTATTLGFTSYLLAMNTHVQEKLQVEIDEYFEENPVSVLIMMH